MDANRLLTFEGSSYQPGRFREENEESLPLPPLIFEKMNLTVSPEGEKKRKYQKKDRGYLKETRNFFAHLSRGRTPDSSSKTVSSDSCIWKEPECVEEPTYLAENEAFFDHIGTNHIAALIPSPYKLRLGSGDDQEVYDVRQDVWVKLVTNCGYFMRFFLSEAEWPEDKTGEVSFPDCTIDDILLLGNLNPTFNGVEQALEALYLADRFDNPSLKQAVEQFFKEKLRCLKTSDAKEIKTMLEEERRYSNPFKTLFNSLIGEALTRAVEEKDEIRVKLIASLFEDVVT